MRRRTGSERTSKTCISFLYPGVPCRAAVRRNKTRWCGPTVPLPRPGRSRSRHALHPKFTALAHERLAIQEKPSMPQAVFVVDRRSRCKIALKSRDGEVPTDADRTGTELIPVILDDRSVLERQPRLAALRRESDVDPAHRAAEFPCGCEMRRRRARRDRAARVPLELILSAELRDLPRQAETSGGCAPCWSARPRGRLHWCRKAVSASRHSRPCRLSRNCAPSA